MLARDLVNEPANILGPAEFAAKAKELTKLGVQVELLSPKALEKLGMNALLAVGQGSVKPSHVAVMQWKGAGAKGGEPLAVCASTTTRISAIRPVNCVGMKTALRCYLLLVA